MCTIFPIKWTCKLIRCRLRKEDFYHNLTLNPYVTPSFSWIYLFNILFRPYDYKLLSNSNFWSISFIFTQSSLIALIRIIITIRLYSNVQFPLLYILITEWKAAINCSSPLFWIQIRKTDLSALKFWSFHYNYRAWIIYKPMRVCPWLRNSHFFKRVAT